MLITNLRNREGKILGVLVHEGRDLLLHSAGQWCQWVCASPSCHLNWAPLQHLKPNKSRVGGENYWSFALNLCLEFTIYVGKNKWSLLSLDSDFIQSRAESCACGAAPSPEDALARLLQLQSSWELPLSLKSSPSGSTACKQHTLQYSHCQHKNY